MATATTTRPSDTRTRAPVSGGTRGSSAGRRAGAYAGLLLLTVLFVSPLVFMVSTSFKTNFEAAQPTWIPKEPTGQAYSTILDASDTPVLTWFVNSLLAATAHSVLVVATAALAAYPLARMDFRGKKIVLATIIATLFVPPVILIIPNYLIVGKLQWLDSLAAVIIPTAASAFGVFFLRQFFLSLPRELEEAALLDGANKWQIFMRVIVPLSKPAAAVTTLKVEPGGYWPWVARL